MRAAKACSSPARSAASSSRSPCGAGSVTPVSLPGGPPSVPAVGLPEGLGGLGGAVAVAHVAAEGGQLLAAVGGGVVPAEVEDAVAEQQLAEPERGRGRVVGGGVAAGLVHDDPVLGGGGARQVAAPAGPGGRADRPRPPLPGAGQP